LEPRRHSEQAIVAVLLEAYVNGVSTRRVDRLVEQFGDRGDDQGPRLSDVPGESPALARGPLGE
jgi:transposase-like protein